jgi:photosystem II stability/assembly factor-like uncharacterized protein
VWKLAVNPEDEQVVLAATANHGLLKTGDGGKTWEMVKDARLNEGKISVVVYSPASAKIIFAGRNRGGLLRSEDGGGTWAGAGVGLNAEANITDIVFDPLDPSIIYLADNFSGVYRSVDGGKSWKVINQGLTVRSMNSLAISADGKHLYAGSEGAGVFRLDLDGQPPEALVEPTSVPATATATPEEPVVEPTGNTPAPTLFPTPTGAAKGSPLNCPGAIPVGLFVPACWFWRRAGKSKGENRSR